ncbi:MAG TPA: hypothetical protein VFJ16_21845 [Longimicrobium sp.]|nr:hypothetical protein [Longimicrobium sp.]
MNLSRTFPLAVLLAGCVPPMRLAPQPSAQSAFIGSWTGSGTQSDEPGEWTISTTIAGGEVGAVVGSIAYPSLSCGGDLILRDATTERMKLREHITYGSCLDQGIITLRVRPGGVLAYGWRSDDGSVTAQGQLERARR